MVLFADVIIGTHGMELDRVGLLVDLTPCFNTDKDFFNDSSKTTNKH